MDGWMDGGDARDRMGMGRLGPGSTYLNLGICLEGETGENSVLLISRLDGRGIVRGYMQGEALRCCRDSRDRLEPRLELGDAPRW